MKSLQRMKSQLPKFNCEQTDYTDRLIDRSGFLSFQFCNSHSEHRSATEIIRFSMFLRSPTILPSVDGVMIVRDKKCRVCQSRDTRHVCFTSDDYMIASLSVPKIITSVRDERGHSQVWGSWWCAVAHQRWRNSCKIYWKQIIPDLGGAIVVCALIIPDQNYHKLLWWKSGTLRTLNETLKTDLSYPCPSRDRNNVNVKTEKICIHNCTSFAFHVAILLTMNVEYTVEDWGKDLSTLFAQPSAKIFQIRIISCSATAVKSTSSYGLYHWRK